MIIGIEQIELSALRPKVLHKPLAEPSKLDLWEARHSWSPELVQVREVDDSKYELIVGEKWWRAAMRVGLLEIDVVLLGSMQDEQFRRLIAKDLNPKSKIGPMDIAARYLQAMNNGLNESEIARAIGVNRSHVCHHIGLFDLPHYVQMKLRQGHIKEGHVRKLKRARLTEKQIEDICDEIIDRKLSVKAAWELCDKSTGNSPAPSKQKKDPDTLRFERLLTEHFGYPVTIEILDPSTQRGSIKFSFDSLDGLDSILSKTTYNVS